MRVSGDMIETFEIHESIRAVTIRIFEGVGSVEGYHEVSECAMRVFDSMRISGDMIENFKIHKSIRHYTPVCDLERMGVLEEVR